MRQRFLVPGLLVLGLLVAGGCRSKKSVPQIEVETPTTQPSEYDVDTLIDALGHKDQDIRFFAVTRLSLLGAAAEPALTALTRALKDPDVNVRSSAAVTIGRIGPKGRSAVPELIAGLNDGDKNVREASATALGQMGENTGPIIVALGKAAKADLDEDVRAAALAALHKLNPPPRAAVRG